jgi:hypothetical protein
MILGSLATFVVGTAAWDHNPQEEYHVGDSPTTDFYLLLFSTFLTVGGPVFIFGGAIVYFFSRNTAKT